VLLQIWCYYPQEKISEPEIEVDPATPAYQCFYPSSLYKAVPNAIREVSRKSPGRSIVVGKSSNPSPLYYELTYSSMWQPFFYQFCKGGHSAYYISKECHSI
jgi:hypothetical protein